ncbi:MAG: ethanolamine utilization protein EutP [Clostridia bacterium]|nr:ethanolamine utilization protein EutP [Clostridia bacterium]
MKKRIMIIGPTQSGKTSLVNALENTNRPLIKTQDVIYGKKTIETPGSYIENPSMYRYLIAIAQDASHVLLLIDPSRLMEVYPPGFAKAFNCPVSGVITKIDLAGQNADWAYRQMKKIGVNEPYFSLSFKDNTGVEALKNYLSANELRGGGLGDEVLNGNGTA